MAGAGHRGAGRLKRYTDRSMCPSTRGLLQETRNGGYVNEIFCGVGFTEEILIYSLKPYSKKGYMIIRHLILAKRFSFI
jgi:hypothetical protein